MTPQEAILIVDQATALLQLNRADHVKVVNAINTLDALVKKHSTEEKLVVEYEQNAK